MHPRAEPCPCGLTGACGAQFAPDSLFVFDEGSVVRHAAVWLATWKWLDRVMLCIIVVNSCVLAAQDFSPRAVIPATWEPDPGASFRNRLAVELEPYFLAAFAVEAIVKIVAMGFVLDDGAYLRDQWNWLDFAVVVAGWVSPFTRPRRLHCAPLCPPPVRCTPRISAHALCGRASVVCCARWPGCPGRFVDVSIGGPKLSVLRAARTLRPLRTITFIPKLRAVVTTLLKSLPQLINVFIVMWFIFLLFSVFGVQVCPLLPHPRPRTRMHPLTFPLCVRAHSCGPARNTGGAA